MDTMEDLNKKHKDKDRKRKLEDVDFTNDVFSVTRCRRKFGLDSNDCFTIDDDLGPSNGSGPLNGSEPNAHLTSTGNAEDLRSDKTHTAPSTSKHPISDTDVVTNGTRGNVYVGKNRRSARLNAKLPASDTVAGTDATQEGSSPTTSRGTVNVEQCTRKTRLTAPLNSKRPASDTVAGTDATQEGSSPTMSRGTVNVEQCTRKTRRTAPLNSKRPASDTVAGTDATATSVADTNGIGGGSSPTMSNNTNSVPFVVTNDTRGSISPTTLWWWGGPPSGPSKLEKIIAKIIETQKQVRQSQKHIQSELLGPSIVYISSAIAVLLKELPTSSNRISDLQMRDKIRRTIKNQYRFCNTMIKDMPFSVLYRNVYDHFCLCNVKDVTLIRNNEEWYFIPQGICENNEYIKLAGLDTELNELFAEQAAAVEEEEEQR